MGGSQETGSIMKLRKSQVEGRPLGLGALGLQFTNLPCETMQKSDYEQSLMFLLKVYNSFVNQARTLLIHPSPLSSNLQKALTVWVHPKGISNLVKTFTLQYPHNGPLPEPPISHVERVSQPLAFQEKNIRTRNIKRSIVKHEEESNFKEVSLAIEEEEEEGSSDEDMIHQASEHGESSFNESGFKEYKRGPYKSYSMEEKMQAVRLFMSQHMSITEISRTLGIPCKNIKRWATDGIYRKRGGGRRRTNPGLEEEVYRWINNHHPFGDSLRIEQIQEYALSRSHDPHFKASRGWAIKFMDRYQLRSKYMIV